MFIELASRLRRLIVITSGQNFNPDGTHPVNHKPPLVLPSRVGRLIAVCLCLVTDTELEYLWQKYSGHVWGMSDSEIIITPAGDDLLFRYGPGYHIGECTWFIFITFRVSS